MRIALKIALALVALVVVLLAIEAGLRNARDAALFEQDLRRGQRIQGRALEQVGEITWRAHGLDEARALIAAAATPEPHFDAHLVDEADALARIARSVDDPAAAWAREDVLQVREPGVIRTYLRIDGPADERQALEISTSLEDEEAYLVKGLREFGLVALVLVTLSAAVATWLGRQLVGRRIDGLVARTRRVARGDFTRVESRERDEIGQLARALDEMTGSLASTRVALVEETRARVAVTENLRRSERLATVGTLAAGLAHELGTPLHVIAGRARMIADEAAGEQAAGARVIVEQAARLQRIIEQLLDFARARHAERRPVALASLVAADIELLAPIFQRRGVHARLVRAEAAGEAAVFGDPDQLRQVFTNILLNAAHAMPRGGEVEVRVEADLAAPAGLASERRFARVTITDHGEGIAAGDLPRVFDPFFTTKDVGEGTGLGLAVAHGIVTDHGGLIAVTSRQGEGSAFTVWLPEDPR